MLNTENAHTIQAATELLIRYYAGMEQRSVKPIIEPQSILHSLPVHPPADGEDFFDMLKDVEDKILPGLTHWQHPGFMALFPSNASLPSLLGEYLAAGLAINSMMWDTSPAAAELEQRMVDWLRELCGLPESFEGVIQDTASTGTLTAIIAAREKALKYSGNTEGLFGRQRLILYTSNQAHYSVEKGAKAAGIGSENVRKIATNEAMEMDVHALELAVNADLEKGYLPFMVVATLGTTSSLAFDPLAPIAQVCQQHNMWLHVDAAYAGNAFILPEYRHYLAGVEHADSYLFNPHKWLFTHFDCSIFYVRDVLHLTNTFSANPEYLRASFTDNIRNYKDWGLPLGRRFRSLKLWLVMRWYGQKGLQDKIEKHIALARLLRQLLESKPYWQLATPPAMNVLTIRFIPAGNPSPEAIDGINRELLAAINADGRFYLSGTVINGRFVIRIVPAQTEVEEKHIFDLYELMEKCALLLMQH
jgi:aromatic-L-amino-acid decarboxylase